MDKKEYLMKLVLTCPLHPAYCNCSVKDLKAASITELIEINSRLSDEEVSSIIDAHNHCLEARKQLQEEVQQT
mgnify:CR=1 FL=1